MSNDGWSPKELLARLSTKVPLYSAAPGGEPQYTMEDIAGALAGLPSGPYQLARVKYCFDAACVTLLRREVEMAVMTLAVKHKWRGGDDLIRSLAWLAVEDVLSDRRCKRCGGTRYFAQRPCNLCDGVGMRSIGYRQAAARCRPQMTADAWRMTWAARYKEVLNLLVDWDGRIEAHLYARLLKREG